MGNRFRGVRRERRGSVNRLLLGYGGGLSDRAFAWKGGGGRDEKENEKGD